MQLDGRADARFRIGEFTDPGSFTEFGSRARHRTPVFGMQHKRPAGDGIVTGIGRVDGREIAVFAQDSASLGGYLGEVHASKIVRIVAHAGRARNPVVGLIDSGGARIQEGVAALVAHVPHRSPWRTGRRRCSPSCPTSACR